MRYYSDQKGIETSALYDFAESILDEGKTVKIVVVGDSMYPILRSNTDSVELKKARYRSILPNDIVFVRKDGQHVLHRVYKIDDHEIWLMGDAMDVADGPYSREHLFALVTAIYRKDKRIECSSPGLRIIVSVWRWLRPVRRTLINAYIKVRYHYCKRILKRIKRLDRHKTA